MKVDIQRKAAVATHRFIDYFKGFERIEAVRRIFSEKTDEVLCNLKVEFGGMRGYMGVSDLDGHLIVSAHYLETGDLVDIFLDIIHELVHVRQFMEGKELFDDNYSYIERPTEIEAYKFVVEEAKTLGLSVERICEYLKTEWMSEEEFKKLTKTLNIECAPPKEKKKGRRRIA